jgi:hypothetical protein
LLEEKKRKKEKLLEHYERLKNDVLYDWKNITSRLYDSLGNASSSEYPKSLIPLYVDIWGPLTAPIHFNQLRCHFKHEKYKEIEVIISDIEKSEPKHNKNVAVLMMNLRPNVVKAILDNCKFDLREFKPMNSNYTPHFVLDQIINYFIDKSMGKSTTITVRGNPNGNFQLIWQGDHEISAGTGNEDSMRWLLKKIESLTIVNDLEKARAEATRINELFNVKLKSKINCLILDIEEERLAGECDSKYH